VGATAPVNFIVVVTVIHVVTASRECTAAVVQQARAYQAAIVRQ
jgi:hypothetical protein